VVQKGDSFLLFLIISGLWFYIKTLKIILGLFFLEVEMILTHIMFPFNCFAKAPKKDTQHAFGCPDVTSFWG
jgi:hypothetical protein